MDKDYLFWGAVALLIIIVALSIWWLVKSFLPDPVRSPFFVPHDRTSRRKKIRRRL